MYWAPVDDEDLWCIAQEESRSGDQVKLKRTRAPEGVPLELTLTEDQVSALSPATADAEEAVSDLTFLSSTNAGAVLHNLRLRYEQQEIYTSIGPILIAVNPFEALPLCGEDFVRELQRLSSDALPAHAYTTARSAYEAMCASRVPQSILVGGESGAGKTETTKLAMLSLARVSGSSGHGAEMVLESGVVLEAFGNAKTVHNHNSSRFGKWCAVHFDEREGRIASATVDSFLLEKSRVVSQGGEERNYHVFYQMIAGATPPQRAAWRLQPGGAKAYQYTRGLEKAPGVDDVASWAGTCAKLSLLGFAEAEQQQLFALLAAVLAVGNLSFSADAQKSEQQQLDNGDDAAALLQVSPAMLGEALTVRHVASGRGSSYAVPLTPQQCADARDALAKGLFSGIFDWLVSKLNEGMANPAADAVEQDSLFVAKRSPQLFVGFLDVFGFENFEVNSFEQLCINYANEKLQKHFIDAVGKLQLDDYAREGIETADIHFPDNGAQIECIDGKLGVMSLLDEELALPKASEEAYVEKLHARFGVKQHEAVYARPKRGGGKAEKPVAKGERDLHLLRFTLRHYAGDVTYTAEAWLEAEMEAALAAVPPEVAAAEREKKRLAEAEVAQDITRSIKSAEASNTKQQAAAIAKQVTVLPTLSEWLTAVGMGRLLRPLNANGIELLDDFRGLDKEDLASLDGIDAAMLDELWENLSERGPASAQCAGLDLAMARRDDVMQAVHEGGENVRGKLRVRNLQRNIDLDSKFKPMMLMPGVPPPLDENDAGSQVRRADEDALTAAYSAMMLAPTRDFAKSVAARKTNLDAELEAMAANRPQVRQKRAPTRKPKAR